jgi:23S rRNA (cytidine1920-2'-O)/16S rRNA (cytidine1409-2'-O)-methyltransferase
VSARRRLDLEMVRRKLAPSRSQAQELISQMKVTVSGAVAANAARQVHAGEPIEIIGPPPPFVSRGGEKLQGAIDRFGLDVAGRRCLDVGASTGGFTDCMLQHGAASVVALDVGHGQLHERIRRDERVDVRERTNIRHVTLADFDDQRFDLISIDISFISLRVVAPVIFGVLAAPGCDVVALVKPQFEAGRAEVSKGRGVIRSPEIWGRVLEDVVSATDALGAATMGVMVSPLLGAEGNVEFLAWFRAAPHQGTIAPPLDLAPLLKEAERHGEGSG